ncbi:MAG: glycoside hydrolase, partial [Acidobacteriota bacterium]
MLSRLRALLFVFLLSPLALILPSYGADHSLDMKVTANGYLDARGVSIMLYDNAFSPIFFDEKNAGLQIILHGSRIATDGSLRLQPTPEQWDSIPTIKDHKPDQAHNRLTADL